MIIVCGMITLIIFLIGIALLCTLEINTKSENELNVQGVHCFQDLPTSGNSPQTVVVFVPCPL